VTLSQTVDLEKNRTCTSTVANVVNLDPAHTSNKVASCFDNVASTLLLVWTGLQVDGQCDKLATDDCRLFITLSVHICV